MTILVNFCIFLGLNVYTQPHCSPFDEIAYFVQLIFLLLGFRQLSQAKNYIWNMSFGTCHLPPSFYHSS